MPLPLCTELVCQKAQELGASAVGALSVASLLQSPSHRSCTEIDHFPMAGSLVVLALSHPESHPELDFWGGRMGTPGNRALSGICRALAQWLSETWAIRAWDLPYHVERGGLFLKDAAVLAGLGAMGRNNLVVTQQWGPRVRLRALIVNGVLQPTGPVDFDPCNNCSQPCFSACPQQALVPGSYCRLHCQRQMSIDESRAASIPDRNGAARRVVRYCRRCETACRVGAPL